MTKEEWKEVEERLTGLNIPVMLICDGYKVALMLERVDQFKNGIMVYVNGCFEGRWIIQDCEERRRFLRPVNKFMYSTKQRSILKKMSKRLRKKIGLDPDAKHTYYHFYWTSFMYLKSHLIKHNSNIELVREYNSQSKF